MPQKYQHAVLGGTFDRLHLGHQHLLTTAIDNAHRLTIGLTTSHLTATKDLPHLISDYATRKQELTQFLRQHQALDKTTILPLNDIYGTTLTDSSIDVIIVTPQTISGARLINQKRPQHQLSTLPVITVQLIKDGSGDYISSTKIRRGLIDRRGEVYSHLFGRPIVLSASQKERLKPPQGKLLRSAKAIIQAFKPRTFTFLVGDIITQFAIDHKLPFDAAVIDGFNDRRPFTLDYRLWQPRHTFRADNPPGTIQPAAAKAVAQAIQKPGSLVTIQGEEDLLGFPALLQLPLGAVVFYGQPQQGVVIMKVDETQKDRSYQFLSST